MTRFGRSKNARSAGPPRRRLLIDTLFSARNRFWHLVLLVGIASGLTGALYIAALKALTKVLGADNWSRPAHLAVLALVGLAVGLITLILGNPGDVELLVDNIHLNGGRSDIRDLRALIPVSLLGIAAGSAIGPEAPLVQSTGSIGNWIAMRRRLGVSDARSLTLAGMAAGFALLFGAPLGSAIFALEILHRRGLEYYEALLPAGIGALTGYGLYLAVNRIGLVPVWHFPVPEDLRVIDFAIGVGMGIVGAAVAWGFTYLSHLFRAGFRLLPPALRPVGGGLILGGLAFVSPYALTFGEPQIQHVASVKLAVGTLLLAAAAKFVASAMITSSGWRGGFIIPLFFMGAALGAVVSQVFHVDLVVAMAAGMAACNVGVTKTPFGSTLVVTEMAGMRLMPSTFLAAIVALFLTSRVSMIEAQRTREGAFEEASIDHDARPSIAPPEALRRAAEPPTEAPATPPHESPAPRRTARLDGAHPDPATVTPRGEESTG
ncbi:MAG TPA: chloride channel protein [Acidimicrobiia bacterium]|nr:chloride channel protein [Acidimicrobiia bacterium]